MKLAISQSLPIGIEPPLEEGSLCKIADELSVLMGMSVSLLHGDDDLRWHADRGSEGSAPPPTTTCFEFLRTCDHGSWMRDEDLGVIRLAAPLRRRRSRWGWLVASYAPADSSDRASNDASRVFSQAAAPTLLNMLVRHVDLAVGERVRGDEIEELALSLSRSFEEISLLHRMGQHVNVAAPSTLLFEFACQELGQVLGEDRSLGCLGLPDHQEGEAQRLPATSTASGSLPVDRLERLLERYRQRRLPLGQPFIDNSFRDDELLIDGLERLLMAPLCYQGETLGLLVAVAPKDSTPFDSADAQLLANIATQTGSHWKNSLLFDKLRALLLSLVGALVSAIDAKDPYTRGHSGRVAQLARELGRRLGLDHRELEDAYLCGLLHDIGKIGIREDVLLKPTALTEAEWEHLRLHSLIGARILEPIQAISAIVPGVKHHHESYGGGGYPDGLVGEDIPFLGRLVAVADAFDAMASARPYRQPMTTLQVYEILSTGAGTYWDPRVIAPMLRLMEAPEEFLYTLQNPTGPWTLDWEGKNFFKK